jgi:putative FmdB family regulatory protein
VPTYRYQCSRCEVIHEIFHSISEKPRRKCPECGGRLERLIGSGGGILLKGSGFYTTDYRSASYHREAKKERGADGTAKKKEPKKPDGGKKKESG